MHIAENLPLSPRRLAGLLGTNVSRVIFTVERQRTANGVGVERCPNGAREDLNGKERQMAWS